MNPTAERERAVDEAPLHTSTVFKCPHYHKRDIFLFEQLSTPIFSHERVIPNNYRIVNDKLSAMRRTDGSSGRMSLISTDGGIWGDRELECEEE